MPRRTDGSPRHTIHRTRPFARKYGRAIILFGRNVASYKFALAKALLERAGTPGEAVPLHELAEPFSRYVCEHLRLANKQATSRQSRFLDSCRAFNQGEISKDQLVDKAMQLGFVNVIDAFHIVNDQAVPRRFFIDERSGSSPGIRLTDDFSLLSERFQFENFPHEVEARWRLVETAWELGLPRGALTIAYDEETQLYVPGRGRRIAVTSSRDALNGYQKGACFYCFRPISVVAGAVDLAEVDHFLPHALKPLTQALPVDGVWNLVLACATCNGAKSARVPDISSLQRLYSRNEFLISSHHPLRERIILQTGATEEHRRDFLQKAYDEARTLMIHHWSPEQVGTPTF